MRGGPRAAVLLAVAVVLAGCGGALGSGPPDADPAGSVPDAGQDGSGSDDGPSRTGPSTDGGAGTDATATPAANDTRPPPTTNARVGTPVPYPPGITRDGVVDPDALLRAHVAALAATGYEYRLRTAVSGPDVAYRSVETGTVAGGFSPAVWNATVEVGRDGGTDRYEVDAWANETLVVTRYVPANRTGPGDRTRYRKQYWNRAGGNGLPGPVDAATTRRASLAKTGVIAAVVRAASFDVEDVEETDDGALYTLVAETVNRSALGGLPADARVNATLVVDTDGRVHRAALTVERPGTGGERARSLHYEFALTAVGPEVIERPSWAPTALSTVAADVAVDPRDGYVEIRNDGPDALPAGTTVTVVHDGTYRLELQQALPAGESAYVYFPAGGDAAVLVREAPTGVDRARIRGEYEVTVAGPDGGPLATVGFGVDVASATEAGPETATATDEGDGTAVPNVTEGGAGTSPATGEGTTRVRVSGGLPAPVRGR